MESFTRIGPGIEEGEPSSCGGAPMAVIPGGLPYFVTPRTHISQNSPLRILLSRFRVLGCPAVTHHVDCSQPLFSCAYPMCTRLAHKSSAYVHLSNRKSLPCKPSALENIGSWGGDHIIAINEDHHPCVCCEEKLFPTSDIEGTKT